MAQHDQLDVLDLRGPAAPDQQLQHGYKDEVDEGEEHPAMLPEPARSRCSGRTRVLGKRRDKPAWRSEWKSRTSKI
jgi:hypothetical protein